MQVVGRIKRGYLQSKEGQALEINILGNLRQQEKEFLLVDEAKSQLSRKYVDEFIRKKLQHYAREKGIVLYYLFDF